MKEDSIKNTRYTLEICRAAKEFVNRVYEDYGHGIDVPFSFGDVETCSRITDSLEEHCLASLDTTNCGLYNVDDDEVDAEREIIRARLNYIRTIAKHLNLDKYTNTELQKLVEMLDKDDEWVAGIDNRRRVNVLSEENILVRRDIKLSYVKRIMDYSDAFILGVFCLPYKDDSGCKIDIIIYHNQYAFQKLFHLEEGMKAESRIAKDIVKYCAMADFVDKESAELAKNIFNINRVTEERNVYIDICKILMPELSSYIDDEYDNYMGTYNTIREDEVKEYSFNQNYLWNYFSFPDVENISISQYADLSKRARALRRCKEWESYFDSAVKCGINSAVWNTSVAGYSFMVITSLKEMCQQIASHGDPIPKDIEKCASSKQKNKVYVVKVSDITGLEDFLVYITGEGKFRIGNGNVCFFARDAVKEYIFKCMERLRR